ncbi:MAG: hypothetical protein R2697_10980 [Ilumatobacteraceae bacterium]
MSFPNKIVRRDIGWRAPERTAHLVCGHRCRHRRGHRAVEQMKGAVERTSAATCCGASARSAVSLRQAADPRCRPVLVASTDGVGTKVELAAGTGKVRSIGHDIVSTASTTCSSSR